MKAVTVRRCSESDWPEVRHLHVQMALGVPLAVDVELNDVFSTPEQYWRDFTAACAHGVDQALFVADAEGDTAHGSGHACIGMGHVRLDHGVARLGTLFVNEAHRRKGVGAAILDAQEGWARDTGVHELVGHIPDTSAAVHLAERAGWQRTEELFTAKNRLVERRWVKTPDRHTTST
jgi:GNAT superfamily N-acetyltransferase